MWNYFPACLLQDTVSENLPLVKDHLSGRPQSSSLMSHPLTSFSHFNPSYKSRVMFLFSAGPMAEPDVYLCLKLFPFLVEIMTLSTDVIWRLTRLGLDPEARSLSRNKDPYLIAETQKNCQIKQISCNNSCKSLVRCFLFDTHLHLVIKATASIIWKVFMLHLHFIDP